MCLPLSKPLRRSIAERTYALQDANWNVTAPVGYSTLPFVAAARNPIRSSDASCIISPPACPLAHRAIARSRSGELCPPQRSRK